MRLQAIFAVGPVPPPGSPSKARTALRATVAAQFSAATSPSASPRASTAAIQASAFSITTCRLTICRRPGGCWCRPPLCRQRVAPKLPGARHRFGGVVAELHDPIRLIDVNDARLQGARLCVVEHGVAHDDNQITRLNEMGCGAIN